MEESVYIDTDRIGALIGKSGKDKEQIEKKFNCTLEINSNSGEVIISSEGGYTNYIISNIINAINYGHNPENAMKLEDENYVMDIIDIKNMVRDNHRLKVVLGRVIGKNGSTRKLLSEITKCSVSVKDNYVSIIGIFENIQLVHEALEMLINGASHKSFYSYLERNKTNIDSGLL